MINYNMLLNIKDKDRLDEIKEVINFEIKSVNDVNGSFDALCKYMANNIMVGLQERRIRNYLVDLNKVGIDHVFVIAEYNHNGEVKRVLIDPTFSQFKIVDKVYNTNKELIDELINNKCIMIDDEVFNKYMNIFVQNHKNINLDEYLLNESVNSLSSKR